MPCIGPTNAYESHNQFVTHQRLAPKFQAADNQNECVVEIPKAAILENLTVDRIAEPVTHIRVSILSARRIDLTRQSIKNYSHKCSGNVCISEREQMTTVEWV